MINRGGRTSGTGRDSEPRKTGRHRAAWGGGRSAIFHYANKTHELTFSMAIANQPQTRDVLEHLLEERILVLDGAMGTMIQTLKLDEADFRGEQFASHGFPSLKGCNDLLSITRPEAIEQIHRLYLEAGGHHRDQYVQRQQHLDGGLRSRGFGARHQPGGGGLCAARWKK